MDFEIEELNRRRREAEREVERCERAIGDAQRACKHVRDPHDLNWCEHCGAHLTFEGEPR